MVDLAQVHKEAQKHLAQGRAQRAEALYRQLLLHADALDLDYNAWLDGAARTYRTLCRDREAGYVYLCLGRLDRARDLLPPDRYPAEAALILELEARPLRRSSPERAAPLWRAAGALYAEAGLNVQSAIAYTEAGELALARQRWERVLSDPRLRGCIYEEGLVHFNLGLLARRAGDADEGRRHIAQAQQTLEELADDFESRGERERAFDCYATLLRLGQELGSYENLAEGYLNCIRIYREDNLKFYVLQYYEDFLRVSLEYGEYHAAAALLRDAADYTRQVGLIWHRDYMRRAGEAWWRAGEEYQRRGGPVRLSENAFLSAVDCFNAIGDFYRVRETYRRLKDLPLPEGRRQRYADLLARYCEHRFEPQPDPAPLPEYLHGQHTYPPVWHIDLVEWEQDGDPGQVAASILGDVRYADLVRRRALHVVLCHIDAQARGGRTGTEERVRLLEEIARGLGDLRSYAALRPIERLYGDPDPRVRRAAISALRRLCYKRSFQLVMRGLRDEDSGVRQAALEVLRELHFPHAVDPLIRIFREHDDPAVKLAALHSLGKVGDLCAGEFLIEVLRHEAPPLSDAAHDLLLYYGNPDIRPLLRRHLEVSTGAVREALERILRGP
ncbi:MAG: HEAT repeat domain-containing protein [Myxococcales bacterium]|nr:HEAT repeat domain-containing protein [Myxococcota bacterium]MDW8282240.1 HEAT repeat domain-containing protein [Myxococcales bacterium]